MWPKESKWYELHYFLHHTRNDKKDKAIRVMNSDVEGGFSFEMRTNLREWVRNQNLACARYQAQYRIGAQWPLKPRELRHSSAASKTAARTPPLVLVPPA